MAAGDELELAIATELESMMEVRVEVVASVA